MKNIDYENYGQYLINENIRLFASICEKEELLKIAEKEKELLQNQIDKLLEENHQLEIQKFEIEQKTQEN